MAGGHVLDCEAGDVEVEFDFTNQLQVKFDHGKRPAFRALIQGETNRPMTIGRSILIGERLTVVRTFYT